MAEITPIQMYTTVTSNQDSSVNIDIPADGVLVGVDWAAGASGADADGDMLQCELSFNSTSQRTTNDARAGISALKIRTTAATAASIANTSANKYVDLRDGLTVQGGERIYLHFKSESGVGGEVLVMLHFRFRAARRAATRRR